MLTIQRLNKNLEDKHRSVYQAMTTHETFPLFENCLKEQPLCFALGLLINNEPSGLGLVKIEESRAEVELLYVKKNAHHFTDPFLEAIEKEAKKENCYIILFLYSHESEDTSFYHQLFTSRGWATPHSYLKKYIFDVPTFHPSWYERPMQLPPGYQEFLWQKLKEKDKSEILHKIKSGVIPQQLSPFTKQKPEFLNSLGLKHQDQVIGWMITHCIRPDTLRYTSLFIEKAYQYLGVSIYLLKRAIALQQKSSIRWAEFEINLYQIDYNWLQFIKRRLAPYAQSISIINRSFKEL